MNHKQLNRTLTVICGLVFLFLSGAGNAFADCPGRESARQGQLQMLVLGDSIMWGQGLKREQKFWWRVKCWLAEKTGKEVTERVEAHSGAVIDAASAQRIPYKSDDGEVNLDFPSINEQLDRALAHYGPDREKVDLVLVDGCINDVGVKTLLDPTTVPESLREQVTARCGVGMGDLLRRIVGNFPNAYVVVTGYYRIVSTDTADNTFLRMLLKEINHDRPEIKRMDDREIRRRLINVSEAWYRFSTISLRDMVNRVNDEVVQKGLPPRIIFVEIEFWPEHSFAASETLLWNFVFGSTNLSGFRKILIILSLGATAYKPDDKVRESRVKSCKETFKAPKGKEPAEEKKKRKASLLFCRYASLGHPNHMGAMIYTEAIKGQLKDVIDNAGWNRSSPSQ